MTALPAVDAYRNAANQGVKKQWGEDLRDFVEQSIGSAAATTLTIAAGAITPTHGVHVVDTEAAAASDDLTHILQTNLPDGRHLIIRSANNARAVVVKNAAGGAGQILTANGADITLNDTTKRLWLERSGTDWLQVDTARANLGSQADVNAATPNKLVGADTLWAAPMRGGWKNVVGANGGFEVAQRGAGGSASFALPAGANTPVFDRWYAFAGGSQVSTATQVAGLTPQSRYAAKVQRNAGQTGTGFMFLGYSLDLDEIIKLRGKTLSALITASAQANWSPANGRLQLVISCGTGAVQKRTFGFTAETFLLIGNMNMVPGAAALTYRFTSATVVPANATQMEVFVQWQPVGTAGADDSFTIDDLDVRASEPYIDQFERRPFEDELRACQRHFWKTFPYNIAPAQNTAVQSGAISYRVRSGGAITASEAVRFPVTMRSTPTITFYSPNLANNNWYNSTDGAASGSPNNDFASDSYVMVRSTQVAADGISDQLLIHASFDAGI